MGGGSALITGSLGPLDELALELTGVERPRVCFIGTAAGDASDYLLKFYTAYAFPRCVPRHLPLFTRPADLRSLVLDQDLIYVGGGNTANLLAVWRVHGVDELLREAWEAGVVLAGVSAGSLCWFEAAITDSFGNQMEGMRDGLGFLRGSNCPHYDSEPARRPLYQRLVREGFPPGLAADDGAALYFEDGELTEVVADRPGARAFRVTETGETPLEARLLRPASPA